MGAGHWSRLLLHGSTLYTIATTGCTMRWNLLDGMAMKGLVLREPQHALEIAHVEPSGTMVGVLPVSRSQLPHINVATGDLLGTMSADVIPVGLNLLLWPIRSCADLLVAAQSSACIFRVPDDWNCARGGAPLSMSQRPGTVHLVCGTAAGEVGASALIYSFCVHLLTSLMTD